MGLSVVSQTLCRMDVLPAFGLPIIRTRKWIFGIRCWVSIGATEFGKARVVDRFGPVIVHTIESVHLPYLSHIDLVDDWSPVQRHPGTANPHLLSSTASTPDDIAVDYAVWPLAFLIPRGPTLQPFSHPSHLLSSREETVSSTASSSINLVILSKETEPTPQVKYAPDFRRAGQCG